MELATDATPDHGGHSQPSWLRSIVRLVAKVLVRSVYRIKSFNADRMPLSGPVLLLVNHVSYADAMILGSICPRNARFVMFDTLYEAKALNWFYKLFDTVPISRKKAKEAIRTVAGALKQQQAVALFPEGQLSRTGFFTELLKGYELMARMGGNAPVQPVWIDGLWGSIFSFEGGRFFRKTPKALPYRVTVSFGELIPSTEATPERVRAAMLALSADAFAARRRKLISFNLLSLSDRLISEATARVLCANAMRLLDTSLLHEGDAILCLLPPEHPIAQTLMLALPASRDIEVFTTIAKADQRDGGRLIAFADAQTLLEMGPQDWDLTLCVQAFGQGVPNPALGLTAAYDPASGALLTLSLPDPDMPEGELGNQLGWKVACLGHLLPGLSARTEGTDLVIGGVSPGDELEIRLPATRMDESGFLLQIA